MYVLYMYLYICSCVWLSDVHVHTCIPEYTMTSSNYYTQVQVKECTTRHECLTKNVEAMKTKLKNATEQSAAEQQWLNKEVRMCMYMYM